MSDEPEEPRGEVIVLKLSGKKAISEGAAPAPTFVEAERYTYGKCTHLANYVVDEKLELVECGTCKERLDPKWVLIQLARKEIEWGQRFEKMKEAAAVLEERQRFCCNHCGKISVISSSPKIYRDKP